MQGRLYAQPSPMSSPTGDTNTESLKMVLTWRKAVTIYLSEPTKSMPHMLTIFSTILRSLIRKKASTALIKCKKNAFDLIRKRTSDQTTNHPKKSKKRTSQNTQQLLSSESSDKKETSYSRRIESIKDLYRKANYWLYWFDKKYRKFWNAKAEAICKIKSTTDGVRQA